MAKITEITAGRGRGKRVNIFLDGEYAFSLLAATAAQEGLHTGQELSAGETAALSRADRFQTCREAALRYLGYRPRSAAEVRQRLQRRGFDAECTGKVLAQLEAQGLVDDAAFARFWKDSRESFSPRSRRLTRLELQRKGLDRAVIDEVTAEVDDGDSAYRAAMSRARRLPPAAYDDFRRRLGDYLRRRGFDYEVIKTTVDRVWREGGGSPA